MPSRDAPRAGTDDCLFQIHVWPFSNQITRFVPEKSLAIFWEPVAGLVHRIAKEIWTCLILNSDICEQRRLQWTATMIADTWILALYHMQMRPQTLAHAWGGTISYYQLNQAQSFSSYNDPHATNQMQNRADFSLLEVEGGWLKCLCVLVTVWFCITFAIGQNPSLFKYSCSICGLRDSKAFLLRYMYVCMCIYMCVCVCLCVCVCVCGVWMGAVGMKVQKA